MSESPQDPIEGLVGKEKGPRGSSISEFRKRDEARKKKESLNTNNGNGARPHLPSHLCVNVEDEGEVRSWANANAITTKRPCWRRTPAVRKSMRPSCFKRKALSRRKPRAIKRLPRVVVSEWVYEKGVACSICFEEVGTVSNLVTHLQNDHNIQVEKNPEICDFKDGEEGLMEKKAEMENVANLLEKCGKKRKAKIQLKSQKRLKKIEPLFDKNLTNSSEDDDLFSSDDEVDPKETEEQGKEREYVKMRSRELRRLHKMESNWEQKNLLELSNIWEKGFARCKHCFVEFPRGNRFKIQRVTHMSSHKIPGFYKICPHCLGPHRTQAQLNEHLEELQVPTVSEGMPPSEIEDLLFSYHKCPEDGCDQEFPTRRCLLWHRTATHSPHAHRCPHCERPFAMHQQMMCHVKSAHSLEKRAILLPGTVVTSYFTKPMTVWRMRAELRKRRKQFKIRTDELIEMPKIAPQTLETIPTETAPSVSLDVVAPNENESFPVSLETPGNNGNQPEIQRRIEVYKGKEKVVELIAGVESIPPDTYISATNTLRNSIRFGRFRHYCELCSRCFRTPFQKDAHVSSVHGIEMSLEKPFFCAVQDCGFSCEKGTNLIKHLRRKHTVEEEELLLQKSLAEDKAFTEKQRNVSRSYSNLETEMESDVPVCKEIALPQEKSRKGRRPFPLTVLLLKFRCGQNYFCPECPLLTDTPKTWTSTNNLHIHITNYHPNSLILKDPSSVRVDVVKKGEWKESIEPGVFQVIENSGKTESEYLTPFSEPEPLAEQIVGEHLQKEHEIKSGVGQTEQENLNILGENDPLNIVSTEDVLKAPDLLREIMSSRVEEDTTPYDLFENNVAQAIPLVLYPVQTLPSEEQQEVEDAKEIENNGSDILPQPQKISGETEPILTETFTLSSLLEVLRNPIRVEIPHKTSGFKSYLPILDGVESFEGSDSPPLPGASSMENCPLEISCPLPNCGKTFSTISTVNIHLGMEHKSRLSLANEPVAQALADEKDLATPPKKKERTEDISDEDDEEDLLSSRCDENNEDTPLTSLVEPTSCLSCGFVSKHKHSLIRHIQNKSCENWKLSKNLPVFVECRVSKKNIYKCPICSLKFPEVFRFGFHVFAKHPNTELARRIADAKVPSLLARTPCKKKCPKCGTIFKNTYTLWWHLKTKHNIKTTMKAIFEDKMTEVNIDDTRVNNDVQEDETTIQNENVLHDSENEDEIELPPPFLEEPNSNFLDIEFGEMERNSEINYSIGKNGGKQTKFPCPSCGRNFGLEANMKRHVENNACNYKPIGRKKKITTQRKIPVPAEVEMTLPLSTTTSGETNFSSSEKEEECDAQLPPTENEISIFEKSAIELPPPRFGVELPLPWTTSSPGRKKARKGKRAMSDYSLIQPFRKKSGRGLQCPFCPTVCGQDIRLCRHLLAVHPETELANQVAAKKIPGLIGYEREEYMCNLCGCLKSCAFYLSNHFVSVHKRKVSVKDVINNINLKAPNGLKESGDGINMINPPKIPVQPQTPAAISDAELPLQDSDIPLTGANIYSAFPSQEESENEMETETEPTSQSELEGTKSSNNDSQSLAMIDETEELMSTSDEDNSVVAPIQMRDILKKCSKKCRRDSSKSVPEKMKQKKLKTGKIQKMSSTVSISEDKCPVCGLDEMKFSNFKKHVKWHERSERKRAERKLGRTCQICQEILEPERNLNLHIHWHKMNGDISSDGEEGAGAEDENLSDGEQ